MKKKVFLISIIAIFLLSGQVIANTNSKLGKKITAETPVYLDGKQVGDAVISEGTSFAPVRALAEALGVEVKYETSKEGSVITLTSPETKEITNEMIWEKAEIVGKIALANLEIEQANLSIDSYLKDLESNPSDNYAKTLEGMISKAREELIKSQENLIKYTNELLALESAK